MSTHSQNPQHVAWITLGSNIEPEVNLPAAVQLLGSVGEVIRVSRVWQSSAVGDCTQADFCNAALQLETGLDVLELKPRLREIEARLGRVRDMQNKNAARTIDLDIAFFDRIILKSDFCTIPDPEIQERPFLAVPLAELDPSFLHPVLQLSLGEIAIQSGGTANLQSRDDLRLFGS